MITLPVNRILMPRAGGLRPSGASVAVVSSSVIAVAASAAAAMAVPGAKPVRVHVVSMGNTLGKPEQEQ